MPFFYSQYLVKDEKVKATGRGTRKQPSGLAASSVPFKATKPINSTNTNRPASTAPRLTRGPGSGRLVWHTSHGASGKSKHKANNFKPLKYSADGKKVVHFSTIEVQPFHFDWNLANDVFYTRKELTAMGQSRFDDAATLRQQRRMDDRGEGSQTMDDVDISKRSKVRDVVTLLSTALDDEDRDEGVSIRGIEHFVYPDLQQEMIRRKKEVQREVLGFVRSKRPDPQGWRLAQHSRNYSQWARNVALEKGMKYCMNNARGDPEVCISKDELERFQKSKEELDESSRSLRGSSSFSATGSKSFDNENVDSVSLLEEIGEEEIISAAEDYDKVGGDEKKDGDPDESRESLQSAGDGTGED